MLIYPKCFEGLPRNEWPYGAYALVNCQNSRAYVGSTEQSLLTRLRGHEQSFKAGSHQIAMQGDWDMGHDFYAIAIPTKTKGSALRFFEAFWIARMRRLGYSPYNVAPVWLSDDLKKLRKRLDATALPSHLQYASKISSDDNQFLADIETINNLIARAMNGTWGMTGREI